MSKPDLARLKRAGHGIRDRLQGLRIRSLKIAFELEVEKDDHGGWAIEIANWSGHGVKLGVSLDLFTRAKKRAFWVGFWSKNDVPVKALLAGLPREWTGHRMLTEGTTEPVTDRTGDEMWLLIEPMPAADFGRPFLEDFGPGEYRFFGIYDNSDQLDLERALGFIESVIIAKTSSADDEAVDIRQIERRRDIDSTQRETLIQARRGQGKFRDQLEELWSCCPISRHNRREILRASHIMPWRLADDDQRVSKYNGILLSANLDALFDKYLISFSEDGRLLVCDDLSADELRELGLAREIVVPFKDDHKLYLEHHRTRFEEECAKRGQRWKYAEPLGG